MSRGTRVLFVTGETFGPGGIQRFNRTLLTALLDIGCDVTLLTLNDDATAVPPDTAAHVRPFARRRGAFAAAVTREIAVGHFAVVVIGHLRYATLAGAALGLRWRWPLQCLLVAHGLEVWDRITPAQRRAVGRFTGALCVSRYTRDSLLRQVPALEASRAILFPNALGAEWIGGRVAPRDSGIDGPFVLSVSRLDPREREKGLTTCLEAVAGLPPDVRYVIAGDGPDRGFLERCAARLGISGRVVFLGRVDDATLAALYRDCAAFALPSAQEGFGIVFLEAMAFGAPVVAAAEKGALDVVEHGTSGLLVPFGDVAALTAALSRLLGDPALRERLVAGGRAAVTGSGAFTFDAFRRRTAALPGLACHEAEAAAP